METSKKKLNKVLSFILIIVIAFFSFVPIYWTFAISISYTADLQTTTNRWFPPRINFNNYKEIFSPSQGVYSVAYEFQRTAINSIIIATITTLLVLIMATFAAYSIERLKVPFRKMISYFVILTQMLPPVVLVIPLYFLFNNFGLLDKKFSLILINAALNLPFAIWILSSYFRTLPVSVEDAAIVDGCGYFEIIWRIILPLSKPAIFTSGIFVFLATWNEFQIALVLTNSLKAKTLPVAISEFMGRFLIDYPLMATSGILALIPPAFFVVIFQKYLIAGLTSGAVKE
ncbi:hypothetical protein X928_07015 [Petrotoga miotherma DSM 10691]|uniref:ABC transmembrane type-1 domain-containing protein n=1 Tax=Petrotoga miotherma DSM 10691 TaxID=1434326 RepID=A0A2K1P9V7_9BACT|nr:carbohydrate ABC transporter permease [Petrotoga miotherma]PNR99571.1 hypothetical protein X928_07015 [Petrotoga miotherma DSM 10691]